LLFRIVEFARENNLEVREEDLRHPQQHSPGGEPTAV
jgi:hypothetical protein